MIPFAIILILQFINACSISRVAETNFHNARVDSIVLVKPDSASIALDSIQLKSLITKIDSMRFYQKEFYDNYLSDLRQESNNNINKYNGWLSLWIALITILMGVVPFLMNIKQSEYNKEYINFLANKLTKEYGEECDKKLNNMQDNINKMSGEMQKLMLDMRKISLQSTAKGIDVVRSNKLLTDTPEKDKLWKEMLINFSSKLNAYTESIKDEIKDTDPSKEQVDEMREILIHAHYVLNLWYSQAGSKIQSKHAVKMLDQLKDLILLENSGSEAIRVKYYKDFIEVINQFCTLLKERV